MMFLLRLLLWSGASVPAPDETDGGGPLSHQ
jgi:hypothetical protein